MVHHHRANLLQQQRKAEPERQPDEEAHNKELHRRLANFACQHRKSNDALLRLLLLFCLFSCLLLLFPTRLFSEDEQLARSQEQRRQRPCEAVTNNTICCDRTTFRTDVCLMRGDVRTAGASNSLFLLLSPNSTDRAAGAADEHIRPYTRKWESSIMSTIDELRLRAVPSNSDGRAALACQVRHDVPAVFFSTGGYTGNVYHEFNDGIIPLYITSQHFNRKVVFVMLEYHDWWMTKYGHIVSQLSDYPPMDFANERRTHCFLEAVVGLQIHDELAIDAARMLGNRTMRNFRQLLDDAYRGRIKTIMEEEEQAAAKRRRHKKRRQVKAAAALYQENSKPKLVIVSRNGSRAIENETELARGAVAMGFRVSVLRPRRDTELAKLYRVLNASDVMVGVHGAAMTHFLFMRPGSVFIQIVPLGTDWAAETYYGDPARKLGLKYIAYNILPRESSLFAQYRKDDPVLTDPDIVNAKGWQVTKKVYLDGQNVRLDINRFRQRLQQAYDHWASGRRQKDLRAKQKRSFYKCREAYGV